MALLKIIKLAEGVWKHWSDKDGFFALTRLYAKVENEKFLIVEYYGAKRRNYLVTEIEVYDIGGTAEPFSNFDDLQIRLKELNYIAYEPNSSGGGSGTITGGFETNFTRSGSNVFTLATGEKANAIIVNRTPLYADEWSQSGANITITYSLEDGDKITISGIK